MAILYALVARGTVVLAEHSAAATNAGAVARQVLERLPDGGADSHVSYTQDRYVFHAKRTDGITALCMADDAAGRRIPFAFLEDIHGRFVKTYGRAALTALAYAMNDEFSRVLSQQMDYYSNDPNADRINRMRGEISQGGIDTSPPGNNIRRACLHVPWVYLAYLYPVRQRLVAF
ncbi:hypothetical protein PR202_ga18002 [Eleusine coracana subsp. coracana]|uniref:Longin domain-containing protein n=1 Tax=Eleusine coracana subsp. coracana TaxID=191504 RepID=A0AAV5CQM0_ELECO|nr:hypothetical protein PR202_ga18002 [Eleusine coracana subsp. coracana]